MDHNLIEFQGTVSAVLSDGKYRVRLQNGHDVVATSTDDAPSSTRSLRVGEAITVEISPHDQGSGRLIFQRQRPT